MTVSREYLEYLSEILRPIGAVSAKRMFGGAGLYLDGCMFAIVVDDELWLKADAGNQPAFEAAGLPKFAYSRQGRTVEMGFYKPPDDALESPPVLRDWVHSALAAALRSTRHRRAKARPGAA